MRISKKIAMQCCISTEILPPPPPPNPCILILMILMQKHLPCLLQLYIYQPVKSKKWDKNKRDSRTFRTKKWEAEVEYANGTAKSTMAILYWASLAPSIQVSYVDTIMGKELMPATESLSVYRTQRVMLGVPKFMEESPKS